MSAKREDSLESLGYTSIGTDKPTKAKLKAAADAAGMTLSEYIRMLADRETKNSQGQMFPVNTLASVRHDMANILKAIALILRYPDGSADKRITELSDFLGDVAFKSTDMVKSWDDFFMHLGELHGNELPKKSETQQELKLNEA